MLPDRTSKAQSAAKDSRGEGDGPVRVEFNGPTDVCFSIRQLPRLKVFAEHWRAAKCHFACVAGDFADTIVQMQVTFGVRWLRFGFYAWLLYHGDFIVAYV